MDVKSVIKSHGMTIKEVAERLGINRVTLSQTLSHPMSVTTLQRIANVLGCKVGEFFADEMEMEHEIVCPHCGKTISLTIEPKLPR